MKSSALSVEIRHSRFERRQANSEVKIIEINADRTQMGNVGGGESFYFRDIFSFAELKFTNFYANSIFGRRWPRHVYP